MADRGEKLRSSTESRRSLENARKDLIGILGELEKIGLPTRANLHLRAYTRLRKAKFCFKKKHAFFAAVLTMLFIRYAKDDLMPTRREKCIIDMPSSVHQVFRPPQDCSMCLGIQQVDKVTKIDPALFELRYAYSGQPVVVTDATTNWTAPKVFSFAFFKSLYEGQEADCQFFPYKTEFKSLREVFNMSTSRALQLAGTKPWYIGWSNCDGEIGATLREHYDIPYFLPETAETEKTDWIFMGSSGYGAHMHVDDVKHPSWQAQLKGEKLWILEPPRECHYTCNRMTVTVEPGEIIVLDTNRWYHQTRIVSEEVSITIGAEYD
ncbi:uncharacterized protein LOC124305371 [Neodiprion virginianus]|uniref:uncharacterized protein LOC124305371 n=1 Tax=Neodiprion virginianus TaxID=2961670 RepID=UPI001EE6EEC5|nr:uncharacterized protein LOC124305371 [Neodiprion virginianus]XP_046620674.1 uncharacterized protein LOC124305371 [Neodiprion virginianus]